MSPATSGSSVAFVRPYRPLYAKGQGERRRVARRHATGSPVAWPVASSSAASAHGERPAAGSGAGVGAVSRMKRSSAATTAAASSGEAVGAMISSFGRRLTIR